MYDHSEFVPRNKIEWTPLMRQFLIENFKSKTSRQLASALGLHLTVVRTACYELGLRRMEMEYWTEEQVTYLGKNYRYVGDLPMAEIFEEKWPKHKRWSEKHIRKKRIYLGLNRTKEETRRCVFANIELGRYAECAVKRWKVSQAAYFGEIRIWKNQDGRATKFIKTEKGFVHYIPWLWQQHHGQVPKGYVVGCVDFNNMNAVIENLQLFTKAEMCRRVHTHPVELKETLQIFNKLKSTIKKKTHGSKKS